LVPFISLLSSISLLGLLTFSVIFFSSVNELSLLQISPAHTLSNTHLLLSEQEGRSSGVPGGIGVLHTRVHRHCAELCETAPHLEESDFKCTVLYWICLAYLFQVMNKTESKADSITLSQFCSLLYWL